MTFSSVHSSILHGALHCWVLLVPSAALKFSSRCRRFLLSQGVFRTSLCSSLLLLPLLVPCFVWRTFYSRDCVRQHFAFLGRTGSSSCCFFFLEVIAHRRHLPISVLYARAHTTHILIHTQEDFDAAVIADDEQWCLRLVSCVSCSFLSLYLWPVFLLLLLHSLPFGCVDGGFSLIKLFRFLCNSLLSS